MSAAGGGHDASMMWDDEMNLVMSNMPEVHLESEQQDRCGSGGSSVRILSPPLNPFQARSASADLPRILSRQEESIKQSALRSRMITKFPADTIDISRRHLTDLQPLHPDRIREIQNTRTIVCDMASKHPHDRHIWEQPQAIEYIATLERYLASERAIADIARQMYAKEKDYRNTLDQRLSDANAKLRKSESRINSLQDHHQNSRELVESLEEAKDNVNSLERSLAECEDLIRIQRS